MEDQEEGGQPTISVGGNPSAFQRDGDPSITSERSALISTETLRDLRKKLQFGTMISPMSSMKPEWVALNAALGHLLGTYIEDSCRAGEPTLLAPDNYPNLPRFRLAQEMVHQQVTKCLENVLMTFYHRQPGLVNPDKLLQMKCQLEGKVRERMSVSGPIFWETVFSLFDLPAELNSPIVSQNDRVVDDNILTTLQTIAGLHDELLENQARSAGWDVLCNQLDVQIELYDQFIQKMETDLANGVFDGVDEKEVERVTESVEDILEIRRLVDEIPVKNP